MSYSHCDFKMTNFPRWILDFFKHFSKKTSIHGIKFIGNSHISMMERSFWCIITLVALCYGYTLIISNWNRYSANPTVLAIKKDFRNWENPFPAATACFVDKIDQNQAERYIKKQWSITSLNASFNYYMHFVSIVSNLTYKSLYNLEQFQNDESLQNIDWLSLTTQVYPSFLGSLVTSQTKKKPEWQLIMTELGLCFTLNSKFAKLLSPNISYVQSFKNLKEDHLSCHYLNGLCYARYDSDANRPLEYHIHSHLEVIHATSESPSLVKKSEEFEINYKLSETHSLDNIRYLTPNQRKCRFDNEPLTQNVPVFSTSICYMECRYRLALRQCGCKPFFYNFLAGKTCDLKGMLCLSKLSHLFNQATDVFGCSCPQPCNLMVYLKQIPKVTEWDKGYFDRRITFRWGLLPPTTKYERKILFGFQELIVSFGGIMSLFLGMSFISATEILYFICEFIYEVITRKKITVKNFIQAT